MIRKHIKSMNENFMMDDTKVAPGIKQPLPGIKTPPKKNPFLPTQNPNEKEKGKPMATADEVTDLFIEKLKEIKDTPEGQEIIKNLHNKYAR